MCLGLQGPGSPRGGHRLGNLEQALQTGDPNGPESGSRGGGPRPGTGAPLRQVIPGWRLGGKDSGGGEGVLEVTDRLRARPAETSKLSQGTAAWATRGQGEGEWVTRDRGPEAHVLMSWPFPTPCTVLWILLTAPDYLEIKATDPETKGKRQPPCAASRKERRKRRLSYTRAEARQQPPPPAVGHPLP